MKNILVGAVLFTTAMLSFNSEADVRYRTGDVLVKGGIAYLKETGGESSVNIDNELSTHRFGADDAVAANFGVTAFFNHQWAFDAQIAGPAMHDLVLNGNTVIGEASQVPVTVSILYYLDNYSSFKPYIGAGFNYSLFFGEDFNDAAAGLTFSSLKFDKSVGFAAQIGADYYVNKEWHLNVSAKYLDVNSTVTFASVGTIPGESKLDINPVLVSLNIGYKF